MVTKSLKQLQDMSRDFNDVKAKTAEFIRFANNKLEEDDLDESKWRKILRTLVAEGESSLQVKKPKILCSVQKKSSRSMFIITFLTLSSWD